MHETPWQQRWAHRMLSNYSVPPVLLTRGEGSRVWDDQGNAYIDLIAGIAVNALGHADPRLTAAITEQLQTLGHTSNLFAHEPVIALAERLADLLAWPDAKSFFCNSGAEANEAALKLSRLTGRIHTVVAEGAFHGRTMGALSWTAQPAKQDPFRPLPGDVDVVPFGDVLALENAVTDATAAIVLEPIQGEGGVRVAPEGYLAHARRIADAHGALLIFDEVQTGIGRTGAWFAHQHDEVTPDVVILAKGLGAGLPIGAIVARGQAAELFTPGMHGSTFGGNPVSMRAAHVVLDAIEQDDLLQRATELHTHFATELPRRTHGLVTEVRGRGLLLAAEVTAPAADVNRALQDAGVLANAVTGSAIRMAPALTITDADIEEALQAWQEAAKKLQGMS